MSFVNQLLLFDEIDNYSTEKMRCSVKDVQFVEFVISNTLEFRKLYDGLSCEESATLKKKYSEHVVEWRLINCICRAFIIKGGKEEPIEFKREPYF